MLPKSIVYELRDYQKTAHKNMREIYSRGEFDRLACAASPTGSGKSFLAMGEIVQAKDGYEGSNSWLDEGAEPTQIDGNGVIHEKKILYVAPTNSILSQVKLHIVKSLLLSPYNFDEMSIDDINQMMREDFSNINFKDIVLDENVDESSLSASDKRGLIVKNLTPNNITAMVKRAFPGLSLKCYAGIKGINLSDEEKITKEEMQSAELIVLDEAHRIMADTWRSDVQLLLDNNHTAKILAVTATPDRTDKNDVNVMAVLSKMVYPDDTLAPDMYMAADMYVVDAIRDGKVNAPEIYEPDYSIVLSKQYKDIVQAWMNEKNVEERKRLDDVLSRIDEEVIGIPGYHTFKTAKAKKENENQIQDTIAEAVSPSGKYIAFVPANTNKAELTQEQHFIEQARQIREHFSKVTDGNGKAVPISISFVSSEGAGIIDENGVIHPPVIEKEDGTFEEVAKKDASDVILQQFEGESSTTGGIKIVLSIDKISEGVHVDGIDGVIMCRSIGENSTNVYLQESGRAISSMDPDKPFEAHKKTQVIDLVGNTFKQVVAGKTTKTSRAYDLQKIKELSQWIENNNGKFPDINSKAPEGASDKEKAQYEFEARCAITLKSIASKYAVYRNGLRPLKDRKIIDEIMTLAEGIKLFDYSFGEREVLPSEEELTGGDFLSLNPKQQRFMELFKEAIPAKGYKELSDQDKVIKVMHMLKIIYAYKDQAKGDLKLPPGVIMPARFRDEKTDKIVYENVPTDSFKEAIEDEEGKLVQGWTLRAFLEANFEKDVVDKICISLNDSTLLEDGESGKHLTDISKEEKLDFGKAIAEVRGRFWSSQPYYYKNLVNLFEMYSVKDLINYGILDDAAGQFMEISQKNRELSNDIYDRSGPDDRGFVERGRLFITNNSTSKVSCGNYGMDYGLLKEFEDTSLTTGEKYVNGYDIEGYDINGFDINGYNRYGFDREGIHRSTGEAFDERGFYYDYDEDKWLNLDTGTEYDLLGYDIIGLNKSGFKRPRPIDSGKYYRKSLWYFKLPDGTIDSHSYEYSRVEGKGVDVNALGFDRKGYYVDPVTGEKTKEKLSPEKYDARGYFADNRFASDNAYNKNGYNNPYNDKGIDANGFNKDGFKEVTVVGEDGKEKKIFVHRRTSQIYDLNGKVFDGEKTVLHEDVSSVTQILQFMINNNLPYEETVELIYKSGDKKIDIDKFKENLKAKMKNGITIMKRAHGALDSLENILSEIKDDPTKINIVKSFLDDFPDLKKLLPIRTKSLKAQLNYLKQQEKEYAPRERFARPYEQAAYNRKKRHEDIERVSGKLDGLDAIIDPEDEAR